MAAKTTHPVPTGLAPRGRGRKLWTSIVGDYELRADELIVLEDACGQADLVDRLKTAMKGKPVMVTGSMGQLVAHPLLGEIRQARASVASLLKQLQLPDLDGEGKPKPEGVAGDRSSAARKLANARWAKGGA